MSATKTTCAECGAPLPEHHDAEPDAIPEHVDRCCGCTDERLGS